VSAVAFWASAVVAVASGFAVFRVDSMARATFLLAVSFVAVGAVLLLLDLHYLGVITVLMMVMEMSVMAVFMVMFMMNPAGLMPMSMVHNKRGSLAIAVGTFVVLGSGALFVDWPQRTPAPPADPTHALGTAMMGSKMLVMLVASPVLFATMIAGIALSAATNRYARLGDDLGRRLPADPDRGGVGR